MRGGGGGFWVSCVGGTIHLNERVTRNCNQSRSKLNASTVLPNN